MKLPALLLALSPPFKRSLGAVSHAWLACSLACANHSACQDLRHNHERIAEIEGSLADLESQPPSDERDRRKADLEKRRRMYLADNDREQSRCRPMGEDRLRGLFAPGPGPDDPRR